MSLSDSMFVFDIKVQDLLSYTECKEFNVRCQFADIFNVYVKDPNEIDNLLPNQQKKSKQKVREIPKIKKSLEIHNNSQSILIESSINSLIQNMKSYPIELSLWDKDDPDNKVGSTCIPWSPIYYEYLNKLNEKDELHPAFVSGGYNVFDETTSKRMAIIRLNVKLTFINDKTSSLFQALFEDKQKSLQYAGANSEGATTLLRHTTRLLLTEGKQKKHQRRKFKTKIESNNQVKQELLNNSKDSKNNSNDEQSSNETKEILCETGTSFLSLKVKKSRSEADLDKTKLFEVRRSISQCIRNRDRFNMLNYIYGSNGPLGSNVYCVGYFTVENDNSPTPSVKSEKDQTSPIGPTPSLKENSPQTASEPSVKPEKAQSLEKNNDESQNKYKFKLCNNQTPEEASCSQSQYSVDLPGAAAELITIKKCTQIDCEKRTFNEPPSPPDDRVLLDLTHMYNHECRSNKTEEISGKMKAKQSLEMTEGSCFCTCECTFGFIKRTTYCTVCGGFEKVGDDLSEKTPKMPPFPCPIYHKIQKPTKATSPRPEKISDRDCKKNKNKMKDDDRFKFNYGYTGIRTYLRYFFCFLCF